MKCSRCQQDVPSDAEFCPECGTKLAAVCAQCGTANASGHKFCKKCGHPLTSAAGARPAGEQFGSPETYTPKHLAERILTSKAALEGERKQVTVLFADLKGSMEMLADRDAEEARKILDPVLEHMMEAVHRYEGTVNQVMGDGIMALFGAPLAHEDHAVRACYAALRMQESVKGYAESVRREQGVTIRIRVGLNSGDVVVRSIGSDLRMDYTAVGQTTHLAARMEQLADPGSILLTSDTLALAEGFVHVTPLGPMAVKGLPAPVEVYELVGVSAMRSRLEAAATRGLSRFVGRDAEMEQLRRALKQTRQGRGQVAAAIGEPGVGKSRLTFELTHSHRVEGWLVLEGHSVSYGKATSYLPVIDLLKGYFKIADRDTHRDIREKVTGKILTLDRALEPGLPALLALLDVAVDDPSWQALDPPLRRQRTLDAVKGLFMREAQVQPLLVVFEDLHWIDSETQALLDSLVDGLPPVRLFLLVNYRPEYEHRWGSKTSYTQVRLDPLPAESALELLRGLLGEHATLAALAPVLIQRTQGNPFFLEESVRALVETKVLEGERGAYRLLKAITEIQVPATVQAILSARIDRLPPEEKRLLQSAAVIGKDVALPLLAAIADEREEDLRRGLAHLQAAEFLYEVRLFPETEYTFKHALTHEVAYAALLQDRRRELHARVLASMEQLYDERRIEHVDELARHALQAHRWEAAARYCREAALRARTRDANRDAAQLFERALDALERTPESNDRRSTALDLLMEIRSVYWRLNLARRSLDSSIKAEELAQALGDRRRLAMIYSRRTSGLCHFAEHHRALQIGRQGLETAEDLGDPTLLALSHYFVVWPHFALGNYETAVEHVDQAVALAFTLPLEERRGSMLAVSLSIYQMWSAWCRAETGEFVKGSADGEEALRAAEDGQDRYVIAIAGLHLGDLYRRQGNLARAEQLLRRSLEMIESADLQQVFPYIAARLGLIRVLLEKSSDGIPLLEEAVRLAVEGGTWERAPAMTMLGEACLALGRPEDAHDWATRALEIAIARGERGYEAWILWTLGEIEAHRNPGGTHQSSAHYGQALAIGTELGMRPLMARCHLALGRIHRRTDQLALAHDHLTTAATMLREMDMRLWLEQAEAELEA